MASGTYLADVVVSNTNMNLVNTDTANDGEMSIAVNLMNNDEIVISAFSGGWGTVAPIHHSLDGGVTWTRESTVPVPPGWPNGCPCDWTWDYGRNNELSATILANSPTVTDGVDVVTVTTTNPAQAASFLYFDPPGPPVQAQEMNINAPGSLGNADQPWVIVNVDPAVPSQDNLYVAYDDFNNTDGVDGPDLRVAVSYGVNPPMFLVDNQVGNALGGVNPGLRLAKDPQSGIIWALWGRAVASGAGGAKNIDYMLNRSMDGGATWGLNGSTMGTVIANADSTQPWPRFGTVNALLGGVHHAGVDPTTGDLYYVYGNRDPVTGNDRLAIRRITGDGMGGAIVGPEHFVTGQVEAALPSVAVTANGTVGVFYYTFDGFSPTGFPVFTAHLGLSDAQGVNFNTIDLFTFLSSAMDSCPPGTICGVPGAPSCCRQRMLGDYVQMEAVGNCFYGAFTANGVAFGRPFANHDPIFFRVCVGPRIQVPGDVDAGSTCTGSTTFGMLSVCNSGSENLVIQSITSSDPQFQVVPPSAGFPVVISPDFCFPFQVSFSPTATGPQSTVFTIASNDVSQPFTTVNGSGVGTAPNIVISGPTNFGDVCVGSFSDQVLTICDFGSCALTIASNDPAHPTVTITLMGTTPPASIDVPPDVAFPPTVIQSIGPCFSEELFPISNTGVCDLVITDISITSNAAEYSLDGLPSFPIILLPGEVVGDGALSIRFAPTVLDRARQGQVTVTYVSDPVTGTSSQIVRNLCGEGVLTGARVLVTLNGVPAANAQWIELQWITPQTNLDFVFNVPLQTVTPPLPCQPFSYHREYGTVSNPIQLVPGNYQVLAVVYMNGAVITKTSAFSLQTCEFNPDIVIDFPC